jgi:predicted DNA-binding transcriptional regulator AlpA
MTSREVRERGPKKSKRILNATAAAEKSERSRRAMQRVKETPRTTTAPANVWTPPDNIRPPSGLLTKKQVLERAGGVSFPRLWKWMRAGKFPRARTVGDLKSVWLDNEVEAWMSELSLSRLKDDGAAS